MNSRQQRHKVPLRGLNPPLSRAAGEVFGVRATTISSWVTPSLVGSPGGGLWQGGGRGPNPADPGSPLQARPWQWGPGGLGKSPQADFVPWLPRMYSPATENGRSLGRDREVYICIAIALYGVCAVYKEAANRDPGNVLAHDGVSRVGWLPPEPGFCHRAPFAGKSPLSSSPRPTFCGRNRSPYRLWTH